MIAKNNSISSLLDELSVSFNSLVSKNEAGAALGPTPLNIYRAASLIYELRHNYSSTTNHHNVNIDPLEQSFDTLLSSLDDAYLSNVILKDINAAFDDLTEQAMASLHELTMHPNVRKHKECVEKDLSNGLNAMKALNIIYHGHIERKRSHASGSSPKKGEETNAMRCCRLGFSSNLCSHIAFLYDVVCQANASLSADLQDCLLGTLSSLLCHGLIKLHEGNDDDYDEDDAIQSVMTTIQLISTEQGQDSTCLGDLLQWQEEQLKRDNKMRGDNLKTLIETTFSNQVLAQKEYVFQMLQSSPRRTKISQENVTSTTATTVDSKFNQHVKTKNQSGGSYQHRLVSKIHELFPSYGEGYAEAALACYDHDVERTTLALLELQSNPNSSSIHPRLKVLDPKLPSRRKWGKERYDDVDTEEDLEAKEIQKARIKEMQIQQENEAFLLSAAMGGEYNDEYDDQYDGIGEGEDGVGGMDSGLYDADYEAIKAYNKATREIEADRLFWDKSRNTNQRKAKSRDDNKGSHEDDSGDDDGSGVSDNGEKKYRGPEKGKGGRIIGPDGKYLPFPKPRKNGGGNKNNTKTAFASKASSKEGNGQKQILKGGNDTGKESKSSEEMTKLQKRRKNDNKDKIANHHRKERSLKKSAGM
mmetsp:Transcript_5683/g.10772  ORF Transcript_5683/g.10772 Transcript_5683/m.10772 type:complete len:644 (+) Transcript_5683:95-2026(+)